MNYHIENIKIHFIFVVVFEQIGIILWAESSINIVPTHPLKISVNLFISITHVETYSESSTNTHTVGKVQNVYIDLHTANTIQTKYSLCLPMFIDRA